MAVEEDQSRVSLLISSDLLDRGLGDLLCQVNTPEAEDVRLEFTDKDSSGVYHGCEILVINEPVRCGK